MHRKAVQIGDLTALRVPHDLLREVIEDIELSLVIQSFFKSLRSGDPEETSFVESLDQPFHSLFGLLEFLLLLLSRGELAPEALLERFPDHVRLLFGERRQSDILARLILLLYGFKLKLPTDSSHLIPDTVEISLVDVVSPEFPVRSILVGIIRRLHLGILPCSDLVIDDVDGDLSDLPDDELIDNLRSDDLRSVFIPSLRCESGRLGNRFDIGSCRSETPVPSFEIRVLSKIIERVLEL